MKANVIVFDASMLILGVVFYYGMKRALGKSRGRAFIVGALSFALAIETLAVLCGVVNFYWYSINGYYKHYPLGGYIVWLGLVPLAVMLLFYIVSAASYVMATWVYRKQNIWARSAVAGVIAFLFYLMIEPVAVTNHWWTWNAKSFYVIDIPLFAWLGVFAAVFLFTLLSGVAVLYAALLATQDERIHEAAILRTLGADSRYLRRLHLNEFAVLGLLSGLFAAFGAMLLGWVLARFVLNIPYQTGIAIWLTGGLGGMSVVMLAGWLGTRRLTMLPPLVILRE